MGQPAARLEDESLQGFATPPELPESPGSPQLLVDPAGPTTWVPLSTPRRTRPTPQVIPGTSRHTLLSFNPERLDTSLKSGYQSVF